MMLWDDFMTAIDLLREHSKFATHILVTQPSQVHLLYPKTECYRNLSEMMHTTSTDTNVNAHPKLTNVLRIMRRMEAFDPRDKIYGIFGLLKEMGITRLPIVDYKKIAPASVSRDKCSSNRPGTFYQYA